MDFLRANENVDWTPYFTVANIPVFPDPQFPTNRALPNPADVPFTRDQNAWFEIQFVNNRDDPGFPNDTDKQIIIRATGHGPQESVAIVEWEVKMLNNPPPPPIPPPPPPPPAPIPPLPLMPGVPKFFMWIGWKVVEL
jgi:hypothetical protein